MEEHLADDGPQDGVAEELEPLVGGQPVLGPRGVGQGGLEQRLVGEDIANPPLTSGEASRKPNVQIAFNTHGHENDDPPNQ